MVIFFVKDFFIFIYKTINCEFGVSMANTCPILNICLIKRSHQIILWFWSIVRFISWSVYSYLWSKFWAVHKMASFLCHLIPNVHCGLVDFCIVKTPLLCSAQRLLFGLYLRYLSYENLTVLALRVSLCNPLYSIELILSY